MITCLAAGIRLTTCKPLLTIDTSITLRSAQEPDISLVTSSIAPHSTWSPTTHHRQQCAESQSTSTPASIASSTPGAPVAGRIKETKDSNFLACKKRPSLYAFFATKCGSCTRTEAEQNIRRALTETNTQPTEEIEPILSEKLAKLATQIPTTNWRPLPSPSYNRKPSQKRIHGLRKTSLLRNEFKLEDACGPEAWEDNVVLPVYEAVEDGWNFTWTAETKSLAEELEEDAERKKAKMKGDDWEQDLGDDDDDDVEAEGDMDCDEEALGSEAEAEGGIEGDEEVLGGGDEAEEESNDKSPSETQETIEAEEASEGSVKVCYRFRKTTRGCKARARHWELVEVWA